MSASADLTPWRTSTATSAPTRIRSLTPAPGWFAAYSWLAADGTITLDYQPVAAFAIRPAASEDDDDAVVLVLRFEDGPFLTTADREGGMEPPLALISEAERRDEIVVASLQERAREHHEREVAQRKVDVHQRAVVMEFVRAQPDPAAFAARMRNHGAESLHHAYLAILLADGDAGRVQTLATQDVSTLAREWRKREGASSQA